MKRTNLAMVALVTAVLLATATPLSAQQSGMGMRDMPMGRGMMGTMADCPMMGTMMGGQDMPMFSEGRIAFLKAELGITEAQAKVWDAYAEALRKNLQGMHDMRQTMMTAMSSRTPVERLDTHLAAMESRAKALKDLKPVLTKLYEALSAEQKTKADGILTGMGCMM